MSQIAPSICDKIGAPCLEILLPQTLIKVSKDLRLAINAAAKHQKHPSLEDRIKAEKKAVEAFFKKHPSIRNSLRSKASKERELESKLQALRTASFDERGKYGICYDLATISISVGAKEKFVKAGGVLPPRLKRSWSPGEVIVKLAAASSQKQFDAILKEHGIDWS